MIQFLKIIMYFQIKYIVQSTHSNLKVLYYIIPKYFLVALPPIVTFVTWPELICIIASSSALSL